MKKIKVLEVTQIDLIGKRFNGYDMISNLNSNEFDIKQAVVIKQSNNTSVIELLKNYGGYQIMKKLNELEEELSIKNILSITAPCLLDLKEYKEADIIHFHQFHNANLSIPFIKKIASEKKTIISLHDPYFFTGHCAYPLECTRWKEGCQTCPNLDNIFPLKEDHSHDLWKLKNNTFKDIDIDILVYSEWMAGLVKESPIFKNQQRVHKISFGIDNEKFNKTTKKDARKHFNISDDAIVFFTRAQEGFKGTPYLLEALKKLEINNKNIVILTCDTTNLLDEVNDRFTIIDLGPIKDDEMVYAMNACDVFLMPSTSESFGLMAIEAMACSKPVVVFNNSALPSVTHAPECGYLVKNLDTTDLMRTIKYIIENPKDREKRGRLAKKIVKEEYTLNLYNKKIENLYKEVYKKTNTNKEYKISYSDNENTIQFKYILNDLTVELFGTKHPIVKELLYKLNNKRIKNYDFTYSDDNLENMIMEYLIKLQALYKKYSFSGLTAGRRIKIEKALYFLKNNPKKINFRDNN